MGIRPRLAQIPLRHERTASRNKRLPGDTDHRVDRHPRFDGRFLGRGRFGFPRVAPHRLKQADLIGMWIPVLTGTLELAPRVKINPQGGSRRPGAIPASENRDETSRSTMTGVSPDQWHLCYLWLKPPDFQSIPLSRKIFCTAVRASFPPRPDPSTRQA